MGGWVDCALDRRGRPLLAGFLDVDGVKAAAQGVAALGDVANELGEQGIVAAMGGDDIESAAPGGYGLGDAIVVALIFVEGELVEFDVAVLSGEGIWVG